MRNYLVVVCKLGKRIRVTKRHWDSIIKKHESIVGLESNVKETLRTPHYIRVSKEDHQVFLYYAPRGKYFLCVVCRHLNGDGFIITAYLSDRIKKGETVYETH